VWDDDFSTDIIFRFNGSNNTTDGLLDNDFITNSEDSLVILFKANPQDDWSMADSSALNSQGSTQNKTGIFTVYNARQGDYVLAIYDKQQADDTEGFVECIFTGIYDIKRLEELVKIFPIPTKDTFKIEFLDQNKNNLTVKVHHLLGNQVYNSRLKQHESSIEISTKTWANGPYIVGVYDETKLVYSSKIIVD
jgi:hypothetical protein